MSLISHFYYVIILAIIFVIYKKYCKISKKEGII